VVSDAMKPPYERRNEEQNDSHAVDEFGVNLDEQRGDRECFGQRDAQRRWTSSDQHQQEHLGGMGQGVEGMRGEDGPGLVLAHRLMRFCR